MSTPNVQSVPHMILSIAQVRFQASRGTSFSYISVPTLPVLPECSEVTVARQGVTASRRSDGLRVHQVQSAPVSLVTLRSCLSQSIYDNGRKGPCRGSHIQNEAWK